ncbi:cellulose synthase subunit BcsC-related outer membrane protein [Lichenibacterium dinghuense]|uniref:cellulose synthase subunit BcsC-related outer membrane protein n=1 Tax=Lichenibacterium dinghuense TaxID=2895977 RepID=UPI001EF33597|nr:cellulose synthase subunit BcsC-related outer membrane protein [Lichenibacterium sp. 6Y81]
MIPLRPSGWRAVLVASAAVPQLVAGPQAASAAVEGASRPAILTPAGASPAEATAAPDAAGAPLPGAAPADLLAMLLGQASFWRGRHEGARALDSLRRALQIAPDDADALLMTVRVAAEAGARPEAEAALARLRAAHPGDPRVASAEAALRAKPPEAAALAEARGAAGAGKLADAVARYRAAFGGGEPPPGLAIEYYETLGGTSGGFDEARDGLRRAVAAEPRDLAAQLAYARLLTYRELSRTDGIARLAALSRDPAVAAEAGGALRQALFWLPDEPASAPLIAPYAALHPEDAEVAAKLEAARHPVVTPLDEAGHARNAAFDALKGRRLAEAERDFGKALAMNDKDADAAAGLGLVRLRQGRVAEGRALLKRALALGPSEAEGIAAALRGTEAGTGKGGGDPAAARAVRARYAAVARLTRGGRYAEAEALLKSLSGPRPSAAAQGQLGDIQARAGELKAAEASFRRALAGQPNASALLIGLAGVLLRAGRDAEAEALYARVGDAAGRRAVGRARAERLREEARGVADPVAKAGLYRSAVAADPANPWLRLEMARALAAQGRAEDAGRVMAGIGDGSDPDGVEAAFYFASDAGDLARAAALAARLPAARRTPAILAVEARFAARGEIARATRGLGRAEARAALLALAARPDPTGERVVAVAAALMDRDDKPGARDAVATALAAAPGAGEAGRRLAYAGALLAAGYGGDAAALVGSLDAARLPPGERDALGRLRDGVAAAEADALLADGRDADAYDRLAPRLALRPDAPAPNLALARLYGRRGDVARAAAITAALLDRDPADLDVRRADVAALIDAGDLDGAAAVAAEGVRRAPRDPRAYLASADAAEARDEGTRALADLREARALRAGSAAATDGARAAGPAPLASAAAPGPNPFREGGAGAPPATPGVLGEAGVDGLPSGALDRSIDRDIASLRDRVAPAVQTGLALLGRSGEGGLSRLGVASAPVEASVAPGGVGLLRAAVTPTVADGGTAGGGASGALSRFGTAPLAGAAGPAAAGAQRAAGTALGLSYSYRFLTADVGATPLGFRESNVVGGLELAPQIGRDLRLRFTGDRRAIVNSVLSYAGARDPGTGLTWGGVVANRGVAQLEWAPGRWFFYGGAGGGVVTGHHVEDNPFVQAQLGGSYGVIAGEARELQVGVSLPFYDYGRNDNLFTYGHGGYFSPQHYVAAQIPVTWRDRPTDRLSYKVEASLGLQSFGQKGAPVFPDDPLLQARLDRVAAGDPSVAARTAGSHEFGPAGGIAGEVAYRLGDALRLSARAAFQRAGDYTEGSALVSARYSFDEAR